jgi:antitoxin ChpS
VEGDITQALVEFRRRVNEEFGHRRIVLYGSRARGDFTDQSDIDIAVVLPDELDTVETLFRLSDIAYDVFMESNLTIQPLIIPAGAWCNPQSFSNPGLIANIKRDGVEITR